MAIPDEGLIAQDAQAFELPDVGRKVGAGFYLAVGLMDLIEGEHDGMVLIFFNGQNLAAK